MVTGRPLTLLAIVSVIVILGSLTPLYYYHQHPWVFVQPSRCTPILCMSDCTSKDRLCVDWHSSLCKSVDENGCCSIGTVTTKFSLQCEQACCTNSYAECVGWCIAKLRHNSTTIDSTPQVTFDACRDECRLSGRSWYGERWYNQSGSGGVYRRDALHCFMRLHRVPPPLPTPAQPRTLPPQPTRPAQRPKPTTVTIVNAPIDADNDTTVRYIEFH
jgi:hypothetical protein